jgi:hypothetical protein
VYLAPNTRILWSNAEPSMFVVSTSRITSWSSWNSSIESGREKKEVISSFEANKAIVVKTFKLPPIP